jgi:hypothetical protein
MQRLTNIFSALSAIDDDADLNPDQNPKAGGATSKTRSSSQSSVGKDSHVDKRESEGPKELYKPLVWIDLEMTGNSLNPSFRHLGTVNLNLLALSCSVLLVEESIVCRTASQRETRTNSVLFLFLDIVNF